MATVLTPARLVPPGTILKRELRARGWTQKDLAEIMGRPAQKISQIVTGKKQVRPETAVELAAAFGTSAEFWMTLESNYRVRTAQRDQLSEPIIRRSRLYGMLPISEMAARGWIRLYDSITKMEREVSRFLGTDDLDTPPVMPARFRTGAQEDVREEACIAWLKRVEHLAGQQRVKRYSHKRLAQVGIPALLENTISADGVKEVQGILADVGVHFVLCSQLSKTYVDGAALSIRRNPVVALSLRYDRIDAFWFTLMHELAHVLRDRGHAYLDSLTEKSGDAVVTLTATERAADRKAQNWLVPRQKLRRFVARTRPYFGRKRIAEFASAIGRHPGIVMGRLHWDRTVPYKNMRSMLVEVSPYLGDIIDE